MVGDVYGVRNGDDRVLADIADRRAVLAHVKVVTDIKRSGSVYIQGGRSGRVVREVELIGCINRRVAGYDHMTY